MLDRSRLAALAADRRRGATAITLDLLDCAAAAESGGEALAVLEDFARQRPSFAAPLRLAAIGRALQRDVEGQDGDARLRSLLLAERARIARASDAIARAGARLLPARGAVLTLSRSDAVRALLLAAHAAGRAPRVVVAESRPLREGAAFARDLAAQGLDVTLVADAALPGLVDAQATGVIGVDRLCEDVAVGKIGCYPLALALFRAGRPLLALADTGKILPRALAPLAEESFDPAEVEDGADGVTVRNRYFEPVPLRLVSRIVTEEGIWTRGEVRRAALRLPRRIARGEAL